MTRTETCVCWEGGGFGHPRRGALGLGYALGYNSASECSLTFAPHTPTHLMLFTATWGRATKRSELWDPIVLKTQLNKDLLKIRPPEETSREQVQIQYLKPNPPQASHVPGREMQARGHEKFTLGNLKLELLDLFWVTFPFRYRPYIFIFPHSNKTLEC